MFREYVVGGGCVGVSFLFFSDYFPMETPVIK